MSTLVLNKNNDNGFLDFLSHNPVSHVFSKKPNYNKLSTVKTVVEVSCDKDTVNTSKEFLKILKSVAKNLPAGNIDLKSSQKSFDAVNKNVQNLDGFLCIIGKYEINEPNAKKVYQNLHKCLEILKFMSDYFNLAVKISQDKNELTKSKKIFSLEDLKNLIAA